MSSQLNVESLGQVFTPQAVVAQMLALRRNHGRTLDPAAGDGAFCSQIDACEAIEIDARVAPPGARVMDFFSLPLTEKFDTIIGNPPYVRFQDIARSTLALLDNRMFDRRSNLYLYFIERAVRQLNPGGELIFIVPREFIKLTAARQLNAWLYAEGDITDFIETGDSRIFDNHTPNCAIFRFERGRRERRLFDGRRFALVDGQLMFLHGEYSVALAELFDVRVGAVSGADAIFTHAEGDSEFVCSKTVDDGQTRRMIFARRHPFLDAHKDTLLARRVQTFTEANWWQWGRMHHISDAPRIYVNARTRRPQPFFRHPCNNYDGAILALFAKVAGMDMARATALLNEAVDWQELGFICDGRFLFTQRSLQNCLLPAGFTELLTPAKPSPQPVVMPGTTAMPAMPELTKTAESAESAESANPADAADAAVPSASPAASRRCLALFGKTGSSEVAEALASLQSHLQMRGCEVLLEADGVEAIARRAEVAIVLGGDGTLLHTARRLAAHNVPLVGINQGRLGFMTDIARADMLPAIDRLLAGEFTADRRMLLDVRVLRGDAEVFHTRALNDVVVNKGDLGRMIEIEVRVDGQFLYVLRADGMIVATPTGSTAYALSANGPILQPAVPGIALVPLCPHALTHRPITISDTSRINMVLVTPHDARIHFDGQTHFDAQAGDSVCVTRSPQVVTLLHPPGYSYFAMLREKLHWSAIPRR